MKMSQSAALIAAGFVAVLVSILTPITPQAATLPAGFTETRIATGLASPTSMAMSPDGRIFVTEQTGRLRVIRDGVLLSQPFVTLSVNSLGERGLLGVALHPDFPATPYIYLYYTSPTAPPRINRVSRFTASAADPDVAAAGSELRLIDLSPLSTAYIHNGGALQFGTDGKLYIATGDNSNSANAQGLDTTHGKLLRINPDGSIPADNPFLGDTTGVNQAIWARGLRNPYTFAIDPATGRIHVNDVGQDAWEEVNHAVAGANFGWPGTEGNTPPGVPGVRYPFYVYANEGSNCAIVGAAFYRPGTANFPPEYAGRYFFGDYCGGFIRTLDTTFVDIQPRTSVLTVNANLPNAQLTLDGVPVTAPHTFTSVEGIIRTIGAVSPQEYNGVSYTFQLWSDGGAQTHEITTPVEQSTYSVLFQVAGGGPPALFEDDFESAGGWIRTPGGNTATTGLWQRGDPEPTSQNGVNLQLDGVPVTVYHLPASSTNTGAAWRTQSVSLSRFAGQTVTLRFEACDSQSNGGTVIEAGFDNVVVRTN